MDSVTVLIDRIRGHGGKNAFTFGGTTLSYAELWDKIAAWREDPVFAAGGAEGGAGPAQGDGGGRGVIGIQSDFNPDAIALLLAAFSEGFVAALIPRDAKSPQTYASESHCPVIYRFEAGGLVLDRFPVPGSHPILEGLREKREPGFVIFSSGTSGKPKAIAHSALRFFTKFAGADKSLTTLAFLLFDHIAGLDTLFYSLFTGSHLVFPPDRSVDAVCGLIQAHRVQVLPTSPTFLNLLCMAGGNERFDLSSLEIITYGSEPMSPHLLQRLNEVFPRQKIIQKYGMSEIGSPKSKSRGNGELWIKIESGETSVRIVDGILWIKSASTMLGYLNAPFSITEDGYFCTGDRVEQDGDWIRILGRDSELIIVGGEKVYPAEVESVIEQIPDVVQVLVEGRPHPMLGRLLAARLKLRDGADEKETIKAIRRHCRERLQPYKIPIKFEVEADLFSSDRQKKIRA